MPKNSMTALAVAVARGSSIAAWCKKTGVSRRSAYRWARTTEFRAMVADCRRRATDRAVGRLARHAARAVDQIVALAQTAESEAVRLNAARAVLAELLAVQGHAELERRMAQVEEQVRARKPGEPARSS